jgi:hypothetical protein
MTWSLWIHLDVTPALETLTTVGIPKFHLDAAVVQVSKPVRN